MTFKMAKKAQAIKIYNLRADTNEFIGAGDAYIPAHTGLPAYCTDIEPMEVPEGKVAVFNSSESIWSLVDDHRGKIVFDTVTGDEMTITELGPLPENTTSIAPDGQYQKWNGKAWVHDAGAEKIALIAQATQQKESLLALAASKIAPLQDAVDLGIATEEESALLIEWKKYRVLINRINPDDAPDIDWPEQPA